MVKVNVGHQTLVIRHQTSDITQSHIGHQTSDTRHWSSSDIGLRTSNIGHLTSKHKHQPSDIIYRTRGTESDNRHQTSDINHQTSVIAHQTSDIRPQTSDIGHRRFVAQLLSRTLATDTEVENCSSRC